MTDDNNDNADDGDFNVPLGDILGVSFMATPYQDLDLAFGAIDSSINHTLTFLGWVLQHCTGSARLV